LQQVLLAVGKADGGVQVEFLCSGKQLDFIYEGIDIGLQFCADKDGVRECGRQFFSVEFSGQVGFIQDGKDFFGGEFIEQFAVELLGGLIVVEDEQDKVCGLEDFDALLLGGLVDRGCREDFAQAGGVD
jgi:hypothetical protein